ELVSAAKSNRAAALEMIRGEVEIAVGRLGLVPAADLAAARAQIASLEQAVAELRHGPARTAAAASPRLARTKTRPPRAALKRAAAKATSGGPASTGAAGSARTTA